MRRLAILGAGGHGKVVADCAELSGWDEIVFFDDNCPTKNSNAHWRTVGNSSDLLKQVKIFDGVFVAIGNNVTRCYEFYRLSEAGANIPIIIHPAATVSRYVSIGAGSVVVAGAVVNIDSKIGIGSIINTGATVGHDCFLGDFVHVCPGTNLAGEVVVSDRSWVGAGSVVRQRIKVGADVTIGAGAVVVSNIPDCCIVTGVPARPWPQ